MKDWVVVVLTMVLLAGGIYVVADVKYKLFLSGMVIAWPVLALLVSWLWGKLFNGP